MSTASMTLRSLQRRAPAAGLGREFYHDAAIYDLDLQLIFYREWLFAAHEAELHGTGSYVTLQVGAYPVVLVRAASGAIRAFVNSCRHRGSRVCAAARGRAAKLVCPYHQWTYDLDGRLFAARQMGAGFDRTPFALRRVHCEAIAGYVFICLADEAPDFTATRVQLTAYLAPHRLHEAKVLGHVIGAGVRLATLPLVAASSAVSAGQPQAPYPPTPRYYGPPGYYAPPNYYARPPVNFGSSRGYYPAPQAYYRPALAYLPRCRGSTRRHMVTMRHACRTSLLWAPSLRSIGRFRLSAPVRISAARRLARTRHGGRPSHAAALELRDRILEAATELFLTEGYGSTSIEAVSRARSHLEAYVLLPLRRQGGVVRRGSSIESSRSLAASRRAPA